jgi:hypothetical protein
VTTTIMGVGAADALSRKQIPSEPLGIEAVDQAVEKLRSLLEQCLAARRELRSLEDSRNSVRMQDERAYSEALRAGEGDPGQKVTAVHDERIAETRRRRDALNRAVSAEMKACTAVLEEHRSELEQRARKERESALRAYRAGLAKTRTAAGALAYAHAVEAFARSLPTLSWGFDASKADVALPLVHVNGSPWRASELLDALETVDQEPAAPLGVPATTLA